MNEEKITNSQTTDNLVVGTDINARSVARRRLLRMGATGGATVLVTLASRPALACHCVMPSAWGSILATGQTDVTQLKGSVAHHKSELFQSWRISEWQTNGGNCQEILARKAGWTLGLNRLRNAKVKDVRKLVCSSTYPINGLNNEIKWINALTDSTPFVKAILVAELNLYTSNDIPTTCGDLKAIVKDMADGSYTPASGNTTTWKEKEISDYLYYNWLAR